jgi:hypothetical protein
MADDIKFEATGFQSLKAQIREANLAYQALLQDVNATPAAIQAAAAKVGELKDQFDDANDAVNAMTSAGRIQAFTKGISAIAGGFTAINGAMALAGDSGKELQETMVKLQGAIALTQGITALEDIPNAFKNIKTAGVSAFTAIKAAIGATGIGLLLVALGTIAAYWDEITAAVSGVTEEQEKLNEASAANLKTQQNQLDSISQQENILKLQGKSEEDILNMKVAQTNQVIKAAEVNIANMETTKKAQVEAAQRNKDILQGIIRFLTLPLTLLLTTIDKVGEALGQDFGLEEAFSGGLAKLVFDPADVAKEADKTIEEAKKGLIKLKNDQAGFQLQIKEIRKKGAEDAAKQRKEDKDKADAEAEKNRKEKEAKEKDELAKEQKAIKDQNEALRKLDEARATEGLDAITTKYANNLSRLKEAQAEELKQENLTAEAKAAINAKYDALILANEAERQKETVDQEKKTAAEIKAIKDKADDEDKKLEEDKRNRRNAAAQESFNLASSTISQILSLEQAALSASLSNEKLTEAEREKIAKESFEKQKKLQIALALIDSAKTVTSILAQYPKFDGGIAMFAALATTAVTLGFAIAKINAVQYESPNRSTSSTSSSPQSSPSTYEQGGLLMGNSHDMGGIRTSMGELEGGEFVMNRRATANFLPLLESINTIGNTPGPQIPVASPTPIIKTYVVATDMTSQQEANARLNALARL